MVSILTIRYSGYSLDIDAVHSAEEIAVKAIQELGFPLVIALVDIVDIDVQQTVEALFARIADSMCP